MVTVTTQLPTPLQTPLQPAKYEPAAGFAVSVTKVRELGVLIRNNEQIERLDTNNLAAGILDNCHRRILCGAHAAAGQKDQNGRDADMALPDPKGRHDHCL